MDDEEEGLPDAVGGYAAAVVTAVALLANLLEARGVLETGDYAAAIRKAREAVEPIPGAGQRHFDLIFEILLAAVEGRTPPDLTLIRGGKNDDPDQAD